MADTEMDKSSEAFRLNLLRTAADYRCRCPRCRDALAEALSLEIVRYLIEQDL